MMRGLEIPVASKITVKDTLPFDRKYHHDPLEIFMNHRISHSKRGFLPKNYIAKLDLYHQGNSELG